MFRYLDSDNDIQDENIYKLSLSLSPSPFPIPSPPPPQSIKPRNRKESSFLLYGGQGWGGKGHEIVKSSCGRGFQEGEVGGRGYGPSLLISKFFFFFLEREEGREGKEGRREGGLVKGPEESYVGRKEEGNRAP